MIDHVYRGITFRVNENEPRNRWNDYCQALLDYSQRHSKPSKGTSKVIPSTRRINPLGGRTAPLESTQEGGQHNPPILAVDDSPEQRYSQGNYRGLCRSCGKPMKRTGRRGRAPIVHRGGCE